MNLGTGATSIQIIAVGNGDVPREKCSCNELIYFLLSNAQLAYYLPSSPFLWLLPDSTGRF